MKSIYLKNSNKIARTVFKKSSIGLIFALALTACISACGQRGALFIPTAPEAAQRSSIVNTLTTPAQTDEQTNTPKDTQKK